MFEGTLNLQMEYYFQNSDQYVLFHINHFKIFSKFFLFLFQNNYCILEKQIENWRALQDMSFCYR